MKYVLMITVCLFSFNVNAKYNAPAGSFNSFKNEADYVANRNMRELSKDGKGITLKDYKNRKLTRYDEQQIRQQKKKGTYVSPEQEFQKMDADADGVVTELEMAKYLSETKYDNRRKTKDQERKIKAEERKGTYVSPSQRYEVKGLEPDIERIDTAPAENSEKSDY